MGEVTDFTEYRKKRKRKKLVRFLAWILLICGVTYGISLLLYESGADDVGGALDAMFQMDGGESRFPINSPGGEIKEMFSLGGSICVLNDTNVFFYSSGGEMTGSIQHRYQTPIVRSEKSRFLLYDQGNKQYALYNKDKLIREVETENIIYLGDISRKGEYAIAAKGNSLTEVTFYQSDGGEVFTWESNDKLATALCLSDDGEYLAVGCANTEGGRMVSSVVLLNTDKMQVIETITLEDELIVELCQQGSGFLTVTDRQAFQCNYRGETVYTYSFEGQPLCGFDITKKNIVFLLGDFRHNRYYTLVALNGILKEQGRALIDRKVYSVENDDYGIYLLTGSRLHVYDGEAAWREEAELQDIQSIYPMGHYLLAATSDRIYKLDFA